ncbi:conserved hypothetical protein [Paraburkholderia tropica]
MSENWDDKAQAEARTRYETEYEALINKAITADDSALETMSDLEELWLSVAPNKTSDDFEAEVHEPFNTDDPDLDAMEAEFTQSADTDPHALGSWPLIESPIRISYGYAYLARLAAVSDGANQMAWNYVETASFWHGYALGLVRASSAFTNTSSISELARKAAHARNAENRAIKSEAFAWLDNNFELCASKDDAAEKLTRVVPVVFRTARRYVTQWHLSRH